MYYTYKETPMGTVLLTRDGDVLTGLHWTVFKRAPRVAHDWIEDEAAFADVFEQLKQYYTGARQSFDLPFALRGTAFQMDVWHELEKIAYGEVSSYRAVAEAIGRPKAVRAVGTAIGNNPLSIIVPCHRVLTSDGKLGGYAGGLPAKQRLLQTEGLHY